MDVQLELTCFYECYEAGNNVLRVSVGNLLKLFKSLKLPEKRKKIHAYVS